MNYAVAVYMNWMFGFLRFKSSYYIQAIHHVECLSSCAAALKRGNDSDFTQSLLYIFFNVNFVGLAFVALLSPSEQHRLTFYALSIYILAEKRK